MTRIVLATMLTACVGWNRQADLTTPKSASCAQQVDESDHLGKLKPVHPKLPNVDQIAELVHLQLGDKAEAKVNICISDGRVTSIGLVRGSSYEPFDRALVLDVMDWQFADVADNNNTCEQAVISYRPPS